MVRDTVSMCSQDKLIPRVLIDNRKNVKTYNAASKIHSPLVSSSFVGSKAFLEK